MALLFTARPSLFLSQSSKSSALPLTLSLKTNSLSFPFQSKPHKTINFSSFVSPSSSQPDPTPEPQPDSDPKPTPPSSSKASITDEWGEKSELGSEPEPTKLPDSDPPTNDDEWEEQYVETGNGVAAAAQVGDAAAATDNRTADLKRYLVDTVSITDEWGEKSELGSEPEPTKLPDSDPPTNDDEWEEQYAETGNGAAAAAQVGDAAAATDNRTADLKRCLVDTVYGTELGFRAGPEVRAEVLELVNQLETVNPTRAPVEATQLLDGNWVLLYTAFSELLPLLATGVTPLLKVKSVNQTIDTERLSIVNSTTLASPFSDFSFSASASFEVRTPLRIQVAFKEGTLQPPEIKPSIDLPADVDVFGQRISFLPVQQSLTPLQDLVANISRAISGLPPLKIPIPGDRSSSWLLITYLDEDLRISRGDGGLFVLARQGSPLLEQ